ncbi:MAG: hypothetical protein AB7O49_03995 [Sphingomonadales bacterium]
MTSRSSDSPRLPSNAVCALAFLLGAVVGGRARRWIYRRLLGYDIHPTASLGISFLRVARAELGPGSRVGHFSIIRNLRNLTLGENARIGTFNWVFGMIDGEGRHFVGEPDRVASLVMEPESSLTSRHIVDCTNSVTIGAFSTVAGFASQILTHGIDVETSCQGSRPVRIGRYCMIGTGCIVTKGSVIPDGTVLGAGSVFRGQPDLTYHLYSGVPATPVKALHPELAYFTRQKGAVS